MSRLYPDALIRSYGAGATSQQLASVFAQSLFSCQDVFAQSLFLCQDSRQC